jgi:outer membrane receptor for ferrienterochelin and colicins
MQRKIHLLLMLFLTASSANAQYILKAIARDKDKAPMTGVSLQLAGTKQGTTTDSFGTAILRNIPAGKQIILFSFIGYETKQIELNFPLNDPENSIEVFLESQSKEEDEVIITSTRSTRTISNIPTRVEFISGEELDEKGNMKAGDIKMLLNESTGIQVQQTSATTANASIRIQGLDGRYTQILKDGFPIYSGAASGLSLLQTPPLDLKQVEIIKGSASTLYGGGAIAGLVNLISKAPTTNRELKFQINGTSARGLDIDGYYGQRFAKTGLAIFASRNSNAPYDPANINLSAIPKYERYALNPKFFLYPSDRTKIVAGVNATFEDRLGGNMDYIKGDNPSGYFEKNKTKRFSSQFSFDQSIGEKGHLNVKNSFNYFNRSIDIPDYRFNGTQNSTFTEANYSRPGESNEWIAGINLWTDNFHEEQLTVIPKRDYKQTTYGVFAQDIWKANDWLHIESGLRGDYVQDYGFVFLPRLSILFKISPKLTSRVGGGLGYKTPTIFTEESERIEYQNVLPINSDSNKLEKSYGVNADINYRTSLFDGKVSVSLNQLVFYTRLNNPLLLTSIAGGLYKFINATGHLDTRGTETNIKIGYEDFKLFLGYTFTDALLHEGKSKQQNTLTSKHRVNMILMYELKEKWKLGLESYYFSRQLLSDGKTGKPYWICGFMAEKIWTKFSVYINFENFLDTRQTRFDTIYTGDINRPVFRDIYAPLDGFVINGGLKIRF